MTERKTAKPVEAWAVVDKDGRFHFSGDLFENKDNALRVADLQDSLDHDRAPHRVARVRIEEIAP
jgi:hypothetical protein